MTPADFNIEKTAIGMPCVISGAKRIAKPKRRVYKAIAAKSGKLSP